MAPKPFRVRRATPVAEEAGERKSCENEEESKGGPGVSDGGCAELIEAGDVASVESDGGGRGSAQPVFDSSNVVGGGVGRHADDFLADASAVGEAAELLLYVSDGQGAATPQVRTVQDGLMRYHFCFSAVREARTRAGGADRESAGDLRFRGLRDLTREATLYALHRQGWPIFKQEELRQLAGRWIGKQLAADTAVAAELEDLDDLLSTLIEATQSQLGQLLADLKEGFFLSRPCPPSCSR